MMPSQWIRDFRTLFRVRAVGAAFLLLAGTSAWSATRTIELTFAQVVKGQLPLKIHAEVVDGKPTRVFVTATHWYSGNVSEKTQTLRNNFAWFSWDASKLTVAGEALNGSLQGRLFHASKVADSFAVSLQFQTTMKDGALNGTYTGTWTSTAISGSVRGFNRPGFDPASVQGLTIYYDLGYVGATEPGYNRKHLGTVLSLEMSGGKVGTAWMKPGDFYYTDSYPVSRPYSIVSAFFGPDGERNLGLIEEPGYLIDVLEKSATVSGSSVTTTTKVKIAKREGNPDAVCGTFTYSATLAPVGTNLFGRYTITDGTGAQRQQGWALGHVGTGAAKPYKPRLTPLEAAPADPSLAGSDGFQGPYFKEMDDWQNRIYAHGLWLLDDPTLGGPFKSDFQIGMTSFANNKWYDNMPANGYGGVAGMRVLYEISPVPAVRLKALEMAERAGHALVSARFGPFSLQAYYKGDFWWTAWAGFAYLELYKMTADKQWLDAATQFAESLRKTQRSSGTWTWVEEFSGTFGVSNERNDRSYDNRDLQHTEFLVFLGRLRKEAGVASFKDVEDKALAWTKKAIANPPSYLWQDRRPGGAYEALGPTMMMLYLLDYADSYDASTAAKVMQWIEQNLVKWQRPATVGKDFLPRMTGLVPRMQELIPISGNPNMAATVRMALIYLKLYQKNKNPRDLAKAQALAHSALAMQNPRTGLIHNAGLVTRDGYEEAILDGKCHPWTGFKAETGMLLLQYYRVLKDLGKVQDKPVSVANQGSLRPERSRPRLRVAPGADGVWGLQVESQGRSISVTGRQLW